MNMQSNKENLIIAIIGIRSGSKTIKDKNIKILNGKPLVHWIIEAAFNTPEIQRVIVSTDSERYAKIARDAGASVPFLRPKEFSTDASPDYDYVKHCLDYLNQRENIFPDIAVRLMATVPLQRPSDISAIIQNCLEREEVDSSVIVAEARQHPMKALKIIKGKKCKDQLVGFQCGSAKGVSPEPRQQYTPAYFRANAIAFKPRVINRSGTLTGELVVPHITNPDFAIDIDTEYDFKFVEFLLSENGH